MPRFKANLQDVIDSEVLEQDSSSTIPGPGHQPGRKKPTNKVHYYFTQKSNDVFGFAGLYDQWEDIESGQTVGTFSIITTEANPLLAKIHNQKERMPTILRQEDYDFWLLPLF